MPEELIRQLGEKSDAELGRKFGYTREIVRSRRVKRNIKPLTPNEYNLPKGFYKKLGNKPDTEIAEKYDVSRSAVRKRRKEKGIDAYKKPYNNLPKECLNKLGKVADYKLAKKYNSYEKKISNIRKENNIKKYTNKKFSKKEVGEIKWLIKSAKKEYQDIVEIYGGSCSTLSTIKNNNYYKEKIDVTKPKNNQS